MQKNRMLLFGIMAVITMSVCLFASHYAYADNEPIGWVDDGEWTIINCLTNPVGGSLYVGTCQNGDCLGTRNVSAPLKKPNYQCYKP